MRHVEYRTARFPAPRARKMLGYLAGGSSARRHGNARTLKIIGKDPEEKGDSE